MNRDRATHIAEIETIEAALAEAQRRCDEAERDAELADVSTRAERALEIGRRLDERGKRKIDEALATSQTMRGRCSGIAQLQVLGLSHPNAINCKVAQRAGD